MTRRLRENHLAKQPRAARACLFSGCGKCHHSLFHLPLTAIEGFKITVGGNSQDNSLEDRLLNATRAVDEAQCAAIESGRSCVRLQIVLVKLRGGNSVPEIKIYAFLDNGCYTLFEQPNPGCV